MSDLSLFVLAIAIFFALKIVLAHFGLGHVLISVDDQFLFSAILELLTLLTLIRDWAKSETPV